MQVVCPCSNPVITRPKPLRQRNGRRDGRRGGKKEWTGARGGAGGLSATRIRKDDFQFEGSKGLAAQGDLDK